MTLKSGADNPFAWEFVASTYFYLDDKQRIPAAALPGALTAGAGTLNRLNGTGWCPAWSRAATVSRPIRPVAPATAIRMGSSSCMPRSLLRSIKAIEDPRYPEYR